MMMGSLNTVPPTILRMVPLGERHILERLNSCTRSSSGVMVAHLIPTLCSLIAFAACMVILSSVASLEVTDKSKYLISRSK